jgi:hypothetical protein
MLQGRLDEALPLARLETHPVFRNLALVMIHDRLGNRVESDAALKVMMDDWGWTGAYQVAEALTFRGEVDRAFEWLEKAYAQRDPGVSYCASDPFLQRLHDDARWLPFVKKMRLAD